MNRPAAMCLLLALALVSSNRLKADDWPCFGGNSERTFATHAELSFPLVEAWTWQSTSAPQPAWPEPGRELHRIDFDFCFEPVIAQGLVLFGSSADDSVHALDLQSGEPVWTFATGGPIRFAPAISGARCFVASDDGYLYCLDLKTGKLKWNFRGGPNDRMVMGNGRLISRWPLRSGVLAHEGVVYFSAGIWPSEGVFVHALEAETGKVVWTNDTCGLQYVDTAHTPASALGGVAPQGYLVASQGVLLVPTGRSTPAGFDIATGKLLYCNPEVHRYWWPGGTRTTAAAGFFFNPCTQGTFPFSHPRSDAAEPVLFDGTHVYDIRTGKHAKQRFLPTTFYHSNQYYRTLAHGEDLFTIEPGWVRRVTMRDPVSTAVKREVWKSEFSGKRGYTMAWVGKHLAVGSEDAVHVYNAETGDFVWRHAVPARVRGIAAADGKLVLSTESGGIHCLAVEPLVHKQDLSARPPSADVSVRESYSPGQDWVLNALNSAGLTRGCAVLVDDSPQLALRLARETQLQIALVAGSPETRDRLRSDLLRDTELHGHRIAVIDERRLSDLPPYFANAVISTRDSEQTIRPLHRVLHPHSGQLLLPGSELTEIDPGLQFERGATLSFRNDGGLMASAGAVPDAKRRIQGPFEMLWFGGPGPKRMADRHIVNGPRPRTAAGRTFVVGAHHVMAFDSFNSTELWSLPLRDACSRDREVRTSAQNVLAAGVTFAVDNDTVRLGLGDGVHLDLNPATGKPRRFYGATPATQRFGLKQARSFPIPLSDEEKNDNAVKAGTWGTVTLKPTGEALEVVLTARHPPGRLLDRWQLFFDFRSPDEQFGLYSRGAFHFTVYPLTEYDRAAVGVFYKYFPRWMGRIPRPGPDEFGTRPAEVFAAAGPVHPPIDVTGTRDQAESTTTLRITWQDLENLTGSKSATFGFAAALQLDDPEAEPIARTRLFAGESASRMNNGWPVFDLNSEMDGEFDSPVDRSRLDSAGAMPELTDHAPPEKDTARENVSDYRTHPLTQRPTRRLFRPAYGCAYPIAAEDTAFFRSGSIAWYDYKDDTGVRNVFGVRPGCLYNSSILPADGLVTYMERSSGCACNYNFQTSFALVPTDRRRNEDWAVYYDRPAELPVRSMNLNFGVPGDRRDSNRELWLAYPRPTSRNRPALELPVTVEHFESGSPYHFNSDFRTVQGTDRPWIYASGYRGIRRITIQTWPVRNMVAWQAAAPRVDGRLDDPCWDQTDQDRMLPLRFDTPSSYYREYWDRMRVSEGQTDWCFLRSDEKTLYAAFFDTPLPDRRGRLRPWRAKAEGRDSTRMFGDNFYGLALTDDRRETLLVFALSASGAAWDGRSESLLTKDADADWNGDWTHGTTADENGFFGEFGIPLKTLKEAGLDVSRLSANLFSKTDAGAYGIRSTIPMGEHGLKRCQEFLPLGLGKERPAPERTFTLRLHFAEPDAVETGKRVFDVNVQERTVLRDLDIVRDSDGANRALIKEVSGLKTAGELVVDFLPRSPQHNAESLPIISGLELIDDSWRPTDNSE